MTKKDFYLVIAGAVVGYVVTALADKIFNKGGRDGWGN